VVVRKPTTTWKTFEIPWLGLPHKAKSKTFGTERCLDWLLRMAFSYKSIVSGKGGSLLLEGSWVKAVVSFLEGSSFDIGLGTFLVYLPPFP
jgi:hypothetical protein